MAEHRGSFTCGANIHDIPTATTSIMSSSTPNDPGDIASCVVPDYLSALPYDPSVVGAYFDSITAYDTAYTMWRDANGRVTVSASGELTPLIKVTR